MNFKSKQIVHQSKNEYLGKAIKTIDSPQVSYEGELKYGNFSLSNGKVILNITL